MFVYEYGLQESCFDLLYPNKLFHSLDRKQYFKYILWLNLALGFQNLYFYVNSGSLFNLAIGALNIGVWVFYRKLAGVKR